MMFISFGKIAVPAPGTPVQVTTDTMEVKWLRAATVANETGICKLLTKIGVTFYLIKEFEAQGAQTIPCDELIIHTDDGVIRPADFWVDAAVAGEGLNISYGR